MSELNYKNAESLNVVKKVLAEAEVGIKDQFRSRPCEDLSEVYSAVGGAALGAGIGFAGLYFGGTVVGLSAAGITSGLATAGGIIGGGMAAGVAVLAAPAVILWAGAACLVSNRNKARLKQEKEALLQDAVKKHDAIIRALNDKANLAEDRIEYLTRMNVLLQAIIKDLKADLAV